MSNNSDQLVEKYLRMKTKMKKSQKITSTGKGNGYTGSVDSAKTIEVKDLEDKKEDIRTTKDEDEEDKCCGLGAVDWPDDDPRWGNPPHNWKPNCHTCKISYRPATRLRYRARNDLRSNWRMV